MEKKRLLAFLFSLIILSFNVEAARLQGSDITYLGAFRVPEYSGSGDLNRWAWGANGLGYYPLGDSSGPNDGYPGSLLGSGHEYGNRVAELNIPAPVVSPTKNLAQLPLATTLHNFVDVTQGIKDQIEGTNQRFGDIFYLPQQAGQSSAKFYWTIYDYYNVNDNDDSQHGWSNANLDSLNAQGPWHVGDFWDGSGNVWAYPTHSGKTADYLIEIPQEWADTYVGGKTLGTGRGDREAGTNGASAGPTLYATAPWQDGNPPGDDTEIETVPLLYYVLDSHEYPSYSGTDSWTDAAWVDADGKEAVLFFGNKCTSTTHYFDDCGTSGCNNDPGYCGENKGWVCDGPYQAQILMYDTNDLAAVAQGTKQPWEPSPYATVDLTSYIWPQCQTAIGAAGFDKENGLIYVFQKGVDSYTTGDNDNYNPIVHVFSVGEGVSNPGGSDTTAPVISNIASNSITNVSAILSWNTNELSTGYVRYGTSSGVYTSATSITTSSLTHSKTLTNLVPSTTYYYIVNATDSSGNSGVSTQYSFITTNTSVPVNTTTPETPEGNSQDTGSSPLIFKGGSPLIFKGSSNDGNEDDEQTNTQADTDDFETIGEEGLVELNLIEKNSVEETIGLGEYKLFLTENVEHVLNLQEISENKIKLSVGGDVLEISLGQTQILFLEGYNIGIKYNGIFGDKAKIEIQKSPLDVIDYDAYGYLIVISIVIGLALIALFISHLSRKN